MIQTIDFAPLDGITKVVYRHVWDKYFGGVDRYFIPFFSPTPHHLMTPRDLRDMDFIHNSDLPSVPQIMTRNAEDFIWACDIVQGMGYPEANLNLGCPSGTVTAKGKGAGFLAKPEELDAFFEEVFSKVEIPVSVKTRLGISEPEEFERLLEIYNKYPISCLTIHVRVQKEKYRGPLHPEWFEKALAESRNPVCYNGDLRTVQEVRDFETKFPMAERVMIGRGLIADPALARKLHGGSAVTREELTAFLEELYAAYTEFYGGAVATAAQRMREVWFYLIHLFDDAEKLNKQLRRFKYPSEYERIQAEILATCPIRENCQGELF